ncbi:Aly/REF export factor 2 [Smittium culicis]|uniref:Aly/REF export factor 2 n=1 Tax=Smittium culicis TaxID=133412 RepID=A0A1R1YFV5_9FUNG|nr:Aly/REF export factor 2 [Smittium culicis]
MSAEINKSLDEIIKDESRKRRTGGPSRRRNDGRSSNNGNSPYSRGRSRNGPSSNIFVYPGMMMPNQQMMMQPMAPAMGTPDQKGKVLISNLDFKVTEADLRELFQQVGSVRKATLNFDSRGKSKGNGEVWFSKVSDSYRAVEKYNGVTLDGRPMKIEVVVPSVNPLQMQMPIPVPVPMMMPNMYNRGRPNQNNSRGNRGGNRRNTRGGKRGTSEKRTPASKDDLDAQMDSYMQVEETAPAPAAN